MNRFNENECGRGDWTSFVVHLFPLAGAEATRSKEPPQVRGGTRGSSITAHLQLAGILRRAQRNVGPSAHNHIALYLAVKHIREREAARRIRRTKPTIVQNESPTG